MVRLDRRGDIAVITLDRPERRNAVDLDTLRRLAELQRAVVDARVVVLTGEPPAFCAGADLRGVDESDFAAALSTVLVGFTELPIPVLAAIDGPALGAGTQLAIACDLRVATPSSRFGIPAARLGLAVDPWTVDRLGRELGWSTARAMLLGAEPIDAERLHAVGAVHRLGGFDAAMSWADELAGLAPLTIAAHKLAIERAAGALVVDDDVIEARARVWSSADAQEGRTAFLEKRPPRFTGS